MKQPQLERFARTMREFHRHQPWTLSEGGVLVHYSYTDMKSDDLSQWDDLGFALNGRRFLVAWRHPRYVYRQAIAELAWSQLEAEQGHGPDRGWLFEGATKSFKHVGRSGQRKKFSSYVSRQPSEARINYYARLKQIGEQTGQVGIDHDVLPSWAWKRSRCGMAVSVIAPVEVRNERELGELADLVRQLVKQQTTLQKRFPGAVYGKADWLREKGVLTSDTGALTRER